VVAVVVSTAAAVVSMGEVSLVAVSAAVAFVVAVSAAAASVVVNSIQCEADTWSAAAVSTAVAFVVAVLVAATSVAIFAITDFLMMSSSATSAFRGGGAIRTGITVTTRTITMDTATMDTAGTVTTVAPAMDTAMAAEPVMDTAMAADQGVCGGGDERGLRLLEFALLLVRLDPLVNVEHHKIATTRTGSEDGRKQLLV